MAEGVTRDRPTDDDRVVVSDEHFAVDVDEFCDEASLQLRVGPQTGEGDVVHPLIIHFMKTQENTRQSQHISSFKSLNL